MTLNGTIIAQSSNGRTRKLRGPKTLGTRADIAEFVRLFLAHAKHRAGSRRYRLIETRARVQTMETRLAWVTRANGNIGPEIILQLAEPDRTLLSVKGSDEFDMSQL